MATFIVKVRTTAGKVQTLEVPAASKAEATSYGKRTGSVISVKKAGAFSSGSSLSPADRQILYSRLAAMLKSKVGASEALRLMRDTFKGAVGRACGKLLSAVEGTGSDLAAAFERIGYPTFPRTTIALIKAGARGGSTADALKDAAKFEWEMSHVSKGSVKSIAMAFVALVGALGTNIASTHYLGPQIMGSGLISAASKLKNGINLDWVHTTSDIMSVCIGVVLVILFSLILIATVFKKIIPLAADEIISRVPFYNELVLAQNSYLALYGLAVLVRSGVSIEDALKLSAEAAPKGMLRKDLETASQAVKNGQRWADTMRTLHPTDKAALAFAVDRTHVAETLEALADQYRMQYKNRVETVGPMLQLVGAVFLVLAGGVMFAETVLPMLMASSNLL